MNLSMNLSKSVTSLLEKGVVMPQPSAVVIGDEVRPERISGCGVVLYPGTQLYGPQTLIAPQVKLGYEGPVTLENCQVGPGCDLKSGFFQSSVFLEGVKMARGAHVRSGCLLEEEVTTGHTVGLKQTILFPFVTLGSLINFCDCFMAGGTDRKNHSEAGSGYIHFNYTPQQDKATASLIGDVPRGVMVRENPIFLGGQGGLVGPSCLEYGTVIAAGVVFRGDCLEENTRIFQNVHSPSFPKGIPPGIYGGVKRKVRNNLLYMANLLALREWYEHVRRPFFRQKGLFGEALYQGACEVIESALQERLKRLGEMAEKIDLSLDRARAFFHDEQGRMIIKEQETFLQKWSAMENLFSQGQEKILGEEERLHFLSAWEASPQGDGYMAAIKGISDETAMMGVRWLQSIVTGITEKGMSYMTEGDGSL
jgi:UDP-N-acetylglucosamine/UDP-N-acetylgalactosamine diphosphorylase